MSKFVIIMILILMTSSFGIAQDANNIQLPKPDTTGGKPLMQVLNERHSTRDFSADTLSLSTLSNLLWAGCGVNRPDGKRTAPSAMNNQEIDVYVATAHGVYVYDPAKHSLVSVISKDVRDKTGVQPFVKDVPVDLVYVADYGKMGKSSESDKEIYSAADAAFSAENVYLFCASAGLATVVRGSIDRDAFGKEIGLRPDQKVILAQSVGYPKK